ncbi:MAG: esterase-like activity of phytase family protein [Erythrobacter sp.]|uniref:esterase-like activity of phytase family protein n=1 Tax=Erythrobacter sp. TaxID=1042 RepID=UPI0025D2EB14|nr:esterase-like activity of phytase family protein [Erythrobacter sp.]MCL9998972.1 esterase-like activity of phytase family protein [Erythrobacter sp.]
MKADGPRERPPARARLGRLALIGAVALALAPGTFLRSSIGTRSDPAVVTTTPRPERAGLSGSLALTGVWEMTSTHGWFGGFSALVAGRGQALVAGTDRGFLLDLDLTGPAPRAVSRSFRFTGLYAGRRREIVDLESLARDLATDTLWAGFEAANRIMRIAPDGKRWATAPAAMADWPVNSGAETMVRLGDGRFLVIAEGTEDGSDTRHEALLFPGDPLGARKPEVSHFVTEADYDPVDATQLPDGRVLILLRRVEYAVPARFDTAIAIADPRAIRAGATWQARVIERMTGGIFADNFEGIAFVPSADDPAQGSVWLVTDDNFSAFQRTLLIRFDWPSGSLPRPSPAP